MKRFSITTRITIWYTIFLLIITIGFLSIMAYTGNTRASERAKTKLMDHVMDASEEIVTYGDDFIIDEDLDFYDDGVYLSVYDEEKELIEGRRPVELETLPAFKDKAIKKVTDSESQTWYIYDSYFELAGNSVWVRGIVKDFAEESTFSFMVKLALIGFPALIFIAGLGGYIITRRGFHPVRNIIETVEDISHDGDLSRRIDMKSETSKDRAAKDEIYNLAQSFNGMFDKLERAFEKEKQFTSDVSHELRTPLAVMISQSDYALSDQEYSEKAMEVINREAKRMAGLVNRLLMLSRSDSGRLELNMTVIDFSEMCELVVMQQEPIAQQQGLTLTAEIRPEIKVAGDDAMLIRVLLNLVENAMKYSKEGGTITIALEVKGSFAQCSVKDDGIGISEKDLQRIWERFYRVDHSRSEDSAGLGLSMVESLVKAHGGHVEVQSELGKGSCFTIYLPLAG